MSKLSLILLQIIVECTYVLLIQEKKIIMNTLWFLKFFEVIYFWIFVGSIDDFGKRHENVYFRQWPKLHINLVFNAQPKVKTWMDSAIGFLLHIYDPLTQPMALSYKQDLSL